MKSNNNILKRISRDSYKVVNNKDDTIDIYISADLVSELNFNPELRIKITNENINDQSVMIIACDN